MAGRHGERVKVKVRAPAVDGKANEELIRFLAERLGVRQREVRIVQGEKAKSKVIEIEGIGSDEEAVARLLAAAGDDRNNNAGDA